MKLRYSIILALFIPWIAVFGMEPEKGSEPDSPINDVHFNRGGKDSIFYVYKNAIDKMEPGSTITINMFIATGILQKPLFEAAARGCKVVVVADARRNENKIIQQKFKDAGIQFKLFNEHGNITDNKNRIIPLHNKMMVLKGMVKGQPYEKILGGSSNMSGGGCFRNRECLFTSKDPEIVKDTREAIKSIFKLDRQGQKRKITLIADDASPLHDTPKRMKFCSSLYYNLADLMNQRLFKAEPGEKFHFAGMTFNGRIFDGFFHALDCKADLNICCNAKSINSHNYQQFSKLVERGAEVWACYPEQIARINPLQHGKLGASKKASGEVKVILSSANFTEESDRQLNDSFVIPNDPVLYNKVLDEFDSLKAISIPFKEYVNKARKRLF